MKKQQFFETVNFNDALKIINGHQYKHLQVQSDKVHFNFTIDNALSFTNYETSKNLLLKEFNKIARTIVFLRNVKCIEWKFNAYSSGDLLEIILDKYVINILANDKKD